MGLQGNGSKSGVARDSSIRSPSSSSSLEGCGGVSWPGSEPAGEWVRPPAH